MNNVVVNVYPASLLLIFEVNAGEIIVINIIASDFTAVGIVIDAVAVTVIINDALFDGDVYCRGVNVDSVRQTKLCAAVAIVINGAA